MSGRLPRRPRLSLPFTILASTDRVRLVAGEDFRFTLAGPCIETWLPAWLPLLDGKTMLEEALSRLDRVHHDAARSILDRLLSERVLIDGQLLPAQPVGNHRQLSQDRLDLDAALRFNASCLVGHDPWLWLTTGPLGRGYVSPMFLPDDGPCLECLLGHFRRLSPLPELYEELIAHSRAGGVIAPVPFPEAGAAILARLADWKASLLGLPEPPAALFRLHVLEASTMELSAHDVMVDPECRACHGRR